MGIGQACGNRFGRSDIDDCTAEVTGVEIMRWKIILIKRCQERMRENEMTVIWKIQIELAH